MAKGGGGGGRGRIEKIFYKPYYNWDILKQAMTLFRNSNVDFKFVWYNIENCI